MQDKEIICKCGNRFVFSVQGQEFFKSKGWVDPKKCRSCREKRDGKPSQSRVRTFKRESDRDILDG